MADFDYTAWEARRPDSPEGIRAWMAELPTARAVAPIVVPTPPDPKPAPNLGWTTAQIKEYADKYFVTKASMKTHHDALTKAVGSNLGQMMREFVDPLIKRVDELEARNAELDARTKDFRYRGVWREGQEYQKGNFATHDGSVWHCNEPTPNRPGDNSGAWTLAVLHGKDLKAPRT